MPNRDISLRICMFWLASLCWPANVSATKALAPIIYSPDQLLKKITREKAVEQLHIQGFRIEQTTHDASRFFVKDKNTNEILASLFFCGDNLFANSVKIEGGIAAMIRRASQFNSAYGLGAAEATSKLNESFETNSLTLRWKKDAAEIELQFNAASSNLVESQWLVYAAPSICE